MTQDEQMDRLEQSLRRFLKTPVRESRKSYKSRLTADKVGAYVKALAERDCAKAALEAKQGDPEAHEILRKAQEVLDQARDELKH